MDVPKFHRVAAGDYETADGVFRLLQLDGGATRAWNVELTTDFASDHMDLVYAGDDLQVDGARTKCDALALFADWCKDNDHPDPDWRKA